MTRAVFAAGVPAPEVFGEVTLDGRFGIVLGRLDGPTLLQLTRSGGVTFDEAGAILASLGLSVHRISPPPEAWLPIAIVHYFLLMGGPTSERWRRMMQCAEAALRPQD